MARCMFCNGANMTDQSTMALVFIAFAGAITGWACYLYNKRQKEIALWITNREKLFQENIKKRPTLKKATTQKEKTMPLIKSVKPAAFKKNVATEVKAGKPVKQAVAIAYSEKREAQKKGKKK